MAFPVTLGELVAAAQQLANKPSDDQLEPGEWKAHVSLRYGRLHSMVSDTGARCFETEVALNLSDLSLPSDHKATIGVDIVLGSGRRRELAELMVQERNWFAGQTGEARAWSMSGTRLVLFPSPTTGTYKHIYVPQPTRYNTSADSTIIDVLTTDGYEALVWGVASVGLHRSESQQQRAVDESNAALARLREWAVARALTMPRRQVITNIGDGIGSDTSNVNGIWNPASWRYTR